MNYTTENPRMLVNRIDKELDGLFHDYASSHGISDVTLFILYVLCDNGEGCTQSDICGLWSYPRQTVNSSLKKLEKDGYLRLSAVSGNKKNKGIFFTDAGRRLAERIAAPVIAAEDAVFDAMNENELALLISLTQKRNLLLRRELQKRLKNTELVSASLNEMSATDRKV